MPTENGPFEELAENFKIDDGTPPDQILRFLAENADQAFSQTEIHRLTGVERDSVDTALAHLQSRGLVNCEGNNWTIGDDDRLASYAAQMSASSVSVSDDYYGEK